MPAGAHKVLPYGIYVTVGREQAPAPMTFDEAIAAFMFESSRRILREADAYIKAARS